MGRKRKRDDRFRKIVTHRPRELPRISYVKSLRDIIQEDAPELLDEEAEEGKVIPFNRAGEDSSAAPKE